MSTEKSKYKKYAWWIVVGALIVGGGYYFFGKSDSTSKEVEYVTSTAEKGTLSIFVTGTGQVEAVNQVDLKSVVAGDAIDVVQVYVKNDQAVREGELIALLDSEDAQKSVRNAELSFDSAKIRYIQAKRDYENDNINKLSLEAQEITYQQSKNSLADAKEKLEDYYIRAPFDGIVTNLNVSAGDSVSRSDILASVITNNVQANIVLNEVDVVSVKTDDKVITTFDALSDLSLTGKISKINTIGTVSQGVVSYDAEIVFDMQNEQLKPGMNVSASIITDVKQNVLIVPSSAVKNDGDVSYVEVLNDGKIPQQKNVEVGLNNGTDTEILSGISSGDKVVTQKIDPNAVTSSSSGSGFRMPGLGGGSH